MLDLWRSEEMQRIRLLVPAEASHATISALGETSAIQFIDLNRSKSAFQRNFAPEVKRCEELARKLRFFKDQVERANLPMKSRGAVKELSFDELESRLEELEHELIGVNENSERLFRTEAELRELLIVLERAGSFFDEAQQISSAVASEAPAEAPLLESAVPVESKVGRLGFVAGMIETSKLFQYERTLFKATRGNVFLKHTNVGRLRDPATGEMIEKEVFVAFFSGERIRSKIVKISEVFGANSYPFPEETNRQSSMRSEVTMRLRELSSTIEAGEKLRSSVLKTLSDNVDDWITRVIQEKAVFHVMNKLSVDNSRKVLLGEGWIPTKRVEEIQEVLLDATRSTSAQTNTILEVIPTNESPPTHYNTNKFTYGFQLIVEAYGVARYREVNPTLFTIITFPFLFAVMFGDMAHGILMLMFAMLMILREKSMAQSQLGDMVEMLFGGRYVILLMSLFSIYVGIIYNEAFSMPLTFFGDTKFECYNSTDDHRGCGTNIEINNHTGTYIFGLDPIWHGTKTELTFTNSIKMKMSILLGVIHMDLGILMSLFNHQYFNDSLSIWCEFVPQMIFLNGMFGYLCFLIVYKWIDGSIADLYTVLIDMFLKPGTIDKEKDGDLYDGQATIQVLLVLAALFAVPWMLFPKPFILRSRHKKRHLELENEEELSLAEVHDGGHSGHGGHGEFEFGEVMVHQMIHTIEFVLGAVSNTASYLRLWALTLAHSQLSAVFYDRVMMMAASLAADDGLTAFSLIATIIAFFVFAMATLGVLMVMESLSAFLHALRLHWVEYQNKFYQGDGYKFYPFAFRELSKEEL
eukprot:g2669.t1